MTDTTDTHDAIRKALAAGPTPGPWTASNRGSYGVSDGDEGSVYGPDGEDIGAEFVNPIGNMPTIRGELWHRDAVFVAACNPEAIAALLADRDRLAAELEAARASQAAPLPVAEGWQPIETAPKSGNFLVYMPAERESQRIQAAKWAPNVKTIGGRFNFDCKPITHWMPLPAPPSPGTPS